MANGFNSATKRVSAVRAPGEGSKLGSRRIFAPVFKLQVLDSYRNDLDCKGNQRATARKYGIHRRQIQKWLQAEAALRGAAKGCSSPSLPLDCTTARRSASPSLAPAAFAPVDLSIPRPQDPEAWDLSWKPPAPLDWGASRKAGFELEAPPPPPPTQQKPFKLFRPYLLDDEEDEPPSSAFERVIPAAGWQEDTVQPRNWYSVDFKLQTIQSYHQDQRVLPIKHSAHRRQVLQWLQQEDLLKHRTDATAVVS